MDNGTVLRASGGEFLLWHEEEQEILTAVARGRLKKEGVKIHPGDHVQFVIEDGQPVVEKVLGRKNLLFRPKVANVDLLIVVLSLENPPPDYFYLDKVIALAEWFQLPVKICVNKIDLDGLEMERIKKIYEPLGYEVFFTSALHGEGIEKFKESVAGKTVVLIGLTGVGKSTLLNQINPEWELATGEVSRKLGRGRHTTKQVQLFPWEGGLITDTPGFSQLKVNLIPINSLPFTFVEFIPLLEKCRFSSCLHNKEPGCGVKQAVEERIVDRKRYENYLRLLKELE